MQATQRTWIRGVMAASLLLLPAAPAEGAPDQDQDGGPDATNLQALAAEALNPVSRMVKLPLQNNFDFGVGPDRVTQYTLDIEPIVPFRLNEEWNLVTRTIIPVVSQPSAGPGRESLAGLGDLNPSIFLSPAKSRHQFWGFGPTFTFPTGTAPQLTSGQWSLGPSAVYLATPGPWMVGVVANQQWSVGGWRERSVNSTYLQPMVIYHLNQGWYLVSIPVITADWEADAGHRWVVPVGGGAGKIVKLGRLPLNLQLQAFYNVEHPRDSSNWQLRFQILFLFPK